MVPIYYAPSTPHFFLTSLPLLMSWSCTIRLAKCDWICIVPELVSSTSETSKFMAISRASVCDTSFCCINGIRMCGNKVEMNQSLCCTYDIWKLTLAINVLNIWSKSQKDFVDNWLISLISVMHCDSDFGFLNYLINLSWISLSVFGTTPTSTMENFIYQASARPHKIIIICAFLMFLS